MNIIKEPLNLIFKYNHLLWLTTMSDIRGRFAGSVMGLMWVIFYPLMLLTLYAAVWILVLNIRLALFNSYEYVAFIFCGLIPYLGLSEALGMGVPSVVANSHLIKNTLFPIELIPVKAVLVGQFTQVPGTAILLIALIFFNKLGIWSLLLPVIWLSQIVFTIGLVWILSSLNVYLRDLQSIIPVLTLMLLFITPISYTQDMIPAGMVPFLKINPLYFFVTAYQDILMVNQFPREGTLTVSIGLAIVLFLLGFWFFSKMKMVFADNV